MPVSLGLTAALPVVTVAATAGTTGVTGATSAAGTTGTTGTSTTTTGTTTPPATGTTTPPATTTTTTPAAPVTDLVSKAVWNMQMSETIYVNQRQSSGPSAWVPYVVAYKFADGNTVLVREPDCVAYTGPLLVADNLRRAGETYADS